MPEFSDRWEVWIVMPIATVFVVVGGLVLNFFAHYHGRNK